MIRDTKFIRNKNTDVNRDIKIIKDSKSVRIELKKEEYENIQRQAKERGCSLRAYAAQKILDSDAGSDQISNDVMRLIPKLYSVAANVEDATIRKELEDIGGAICRCLK